VTGCAKKSAPVTYCNAGDSGPVVGQVAQIILSQSLATIGESLNYGQIGQGLSASALDCKGNAVSVSRYVYASTSSFTNSANGTVFADINPGTGSVCAGTWNRNTGGGILDYTLCTAPSNPSGFLAYVTATASGAVSNAIPVYVHPVVTGVVLGGATPAGACPTTANPGGNDPGTDCCPNTTTGTTATAPIYNGNGASCLSQNSTGQLVARIYDNGTTSAANNITCQVGHLTYGTQNASTVVAIDQNGIATANQPGSTEITATIAQSSTATNAGFFSTCPPATIQLTAQGYPSTTTSVNVTQNNVQPLTATVYDTNIVAGTGLGHLITGLALEYNSTEPQLIPGGAGSITPIFPGSATITAACNPGTCNPSGFSQIGILGNGKPITSNGITINTAGHSGTVLYAGSTAPSSGSTPTTSGGSQYLFVQDFTTAQPGTLVKLPYVPNSIVITLSGAAIYMGSPGGLMTFTTASNSVTSTTQAISGNVLAISPDASTLVVTDPVRQTISLVSTSSTSVATSYGGVGTRAVWSPDSTTVYITTSNATILSHSTFTDWQTSTSTGQTYNDVAVTVPSVGAFFTGPQSIDGRSYCSSTTNTTIGNPPSAANTFLPFAADVTRPVPVVGHLAATNDGLHMLEADVPTTGGTPTFTDLDVTIPVQACPATIPQNSYFGTGGATTVPSRPLGVTATSITGVLPTTNSVVAFVTYTGTSGLLPYYLIPSTGTGTLSYLPLQTGATAPLSGVLSTDNLTLYVGTAGDNAVHQIGITYPTGSTPVVVDTATPLTPNLPSATGSGVAPVNTLVQYPKKSTS
jgi:hypothetical protein